jgi:hypothetical protein
MSLHSYSRVWLHLVAEQEEHHRKRTYAEELKLFAERFGLKWRDEKTVETVSFPPAAPTHR